MAAQYELLHSFPTRRSSDLTGVRNADGIVESLLGSYKVSTKDFKVSKL